MSKHSQPEGRAIHPTCTKLDDPAQPCTCDAGWGTNDNDIDRAIAVADRLDSRTRTSNEGRGPDSFDNDSERGSPVDRSTKTPYNPRLSSPMGEDYDGFWKHSEDLKCRAGKKMVSDKRGLPPGYFKNARLS